MFVNDSTLWGKEDKNLNNNIKTKSFRLSPKSFTRYREGLHSAIVHISRPQSPRRT